MKHNCTGKLVDSRQSAYCIFRKKSKLSKSGYYRFHWRAAKQNLTRYFGALLIGKKGKELKCPHHLEVLC